MAQRCALPRGPHEAGEGKLYADHSPQPRDTACLGSRLPCDCTIGFIVHYPIHLSGDFSHLHQININLTNVFYNL